MAATIKTTLTDNSAEWVAALKKRFIDAGGTAADFEATLEDLNKELDSRAARDQAEAISELADEHDRLNGIVRAGAGKGGMAANITAVATSVTAAIGVMKGLVEVGKKAYEAISKLAETSPKFGELKASLDGVTTAASDAANTLANTDFGSGAIGLANRGLNSMGEGLKAMPTLWQNIEILAHSALADIQEGLGAEKSLHRDVISLIHEEILALDEKAAAAKKAVAVAQSTKAAAAAEEAIAKATAQAESQRAIAAMTERNEVLKAINAEREAIKARAAAGEDADGEKAKASANKILALKAQERKIQDDEVARLKAGDEAALKRREENDKAILDAEQKLLDDLAAADEKAADDALADAMKRLDLRYEAEKKAAAERVALAEKEAEAKKAALEKAGEQQKGNAAGIIAGLDPRKVAQEVGKQREKEARDAFGKENNAKYLEAKEAGDKKRMKQLEREQNEAGADARRSGFRDVAKGRAGGDEIAQAQKALADGVINQGQSTGRLGQATADGLREAVNVITRDSERIDAVTRDVEQTRQQIMQLQSRGGNSTGRAQRSGG